MVHKFIDFFTEVKKDTWQGAVLGSMLIPLIFYLFTKFRSWITSSYPRNLILTGYRKSKKDILIFLSQLSGASIQNNQLQLTPNQQYLTRFPQPLPLNQTNLGFLAYQNIDPVWSQSDGQCATEVFNLLGQVKKKQGIRIADTIRDWDDNSNSVFTIGFNPKTHNLIASCNPIDFQVSNNGINISLEGQPLALNANYPADAGIIQKTFITNSEIPVFILAGLGTTGTEAAGKVLNENCIAFGKLYGNSSFCTLFKTDITRGSNYYEITGIYPKPKLYRAIWYPITYFKWYQKKVFPH